MLCSHYWDHHHLFVECWTKCWDMNSVRFSSPSIIVLSHSIVVASLIESELSFTNWNLHHRYNDFVFVVRIHTFISAAKFSLFCRLNLLLENSINYRNWISIPMNLKNERAIKKIVFTDRLWNLSAFSTVSHSLCPRSVGVIITALRF